MVNPKLLRKIFIRRTWRGATGVGGSTVVGKPRGADMAMDAKSTIADTNLEACTDRGFDADTLPVNCSTEPN